MGYMLKHAVCCTVCGEKADARRLCSRHYAKAKREGLLNDHAPITMRDSLESRIKKTDGCWFWTGAIGTGGYGVFLYGGRKQMRAHRAVYEHYVDHIPDNMILLHSCDVRECVNPDHLSLGTQVENIIDAMKKRRHNFGERHGMSKLKTEDVVAIRRSQRGYWFLAQEFGVTTTQIYRIKKRMSWKHILE